MTDNSLFSNRYPKTTTVFPCCLPSQTYGTTLFWAEEYWIVMQIQELEKNTHISIFLDFLIHIL